MSYKVLGKPDKNRKYYAYIFSVDGDLIAERFIDVSVVKALSENEPKITIKDDTYDYNDHQIVALAGYPNALVFIHLGNISKVSSIQL